MTKKLQSKYTKSALISGLGLGLGLALVACSASSYSAEEELEPWQQAQLTEIWKPVPVRIDATMGERPSDAIDLFSGADASAWEADDQGAAKWQVQDGVLSVVAGAGDIRTKRSFCDGQFHVEWQSPAITTDESGKDLEGQQRGNSGFFLQERYEVQVLDSHGGTTYSNGQAGSIYKQHIPLANVTLGPQDWNAYDIIFSAPRFSASGELEKPAYITVLHNGVLIQNHVEIQGATAWIGAPKYEAHGCAPIRLQDHGNPVKYRNIWVREL